MKSYIKLGLAIIICLGAGFAGSVFTMPAIDTWYIDLVKPVGNPPSWVFGPVWTTLYILMGIALYLVWQESRSRERSLGLKFFALQLILNAVWSPVFFGSTSLTINGLNNIGLALIVIVLLWLAILATIITFARVSKIAAWLLVPYILWVSYATYLNASIYVLN